MKTLQVTHRLLKEVLDNYTRGNFTWGRGDFSRKCVLSIPHVCYELS